MSLIQRGPNFVVNDEILFPNWEIKENTSDHFEINNNGDNKFKIEDNNGKVTIDGVLKINSTIEATDNISFETNGEERITIDSSGNVGIGNDNPSYKLDVDGTANFTGAITGNLTGNSATATILQTARTIGGVSFNGSAAITPANITVADTTDTTCSVALFESAIGNLSPKTDGGLTYNAGIGKLSVVNSSGTGTMEIRSNSESNDTLLFLGTPYDSSAKNKTAIIAEADGSYSSSNLHFCLNSASDNSIEVSLSDQKMTILKNGNVGIGTNNPTIQLAIGDSDTGFQQQSDNELAVYTNNSERVRFDNSGNVGIGTNDPNATLHVASNGAVMSLEGTDHCYIQLYPDGIAAGRKGYIGYPGASNDDLQIVNQNNDSIKLSTNSSVRMTIKHNGNVGIGTEDPGIHLAIGDTDTGFMQKGDNELAVYTNNDERVRFDGSGNVGIGTNDPSYRLHLNGNQRIDYEDNKGLEIKTHKSGPSPGVFVMFYDISDQEMFKVAANGDCHNENGTFGSSISDRRAKENIVDANSQWDDIKNIRIVNYNLINRDFTQIGVIAQEVEMICPGLVKTSNETINFGDVIIENPKNFKNSILYMKSVKALQEAMQRIEQLESRLNELEHLF